MCIRDRIIEACDEVKIDIEDDGHVVIYHMNREAITKAANMIRDIVRVAKVGDIYEGKVVRIEKFGAFVNLFPGTDGLLHISKICHERVEKVEDKLNIGDTIKVKVMEIDDRGRVNVSAKALLLSLIHIYTGYYGTRSIFWLPKRSSCRT